jgi:hypothetical protein
MLDFGKTLRDIYKILGTFHYLWWDFKLYLLSGVLVLDFMQFFL